MNEVYSYEIEGVGLQTGDVICTTNGGNTPVAGQYWWLLGQMIPGAVDHIALYIGPGGRCIEAGPPGVAEFEIVDCKWDGATLLRSRGFVDRFYGVSFPLRAYEATPEEIERIRLGVAEYCIRRVGRHAYNLDFMNPDRDDVFYCSQLAYKAYKEFGINLNTGVTIAQVPGTDRIVFPQEIWDGFPHEEAVEKGK